MVETLEMSRVQMADPCTTRVVVGGRKMYATTATSQYWNKRRYKLPYWLHGPPGDGSFERLTQPDGDLAPNEGAKWSGTHAVDMNQGYWAPSLLYHNNKFYLWFSPALTSGQRVIYVAVASTLQGLATATRHPFVVPSGGKWAIDPNPYVNNNKLYVAYRDDSFGYTTTGGAGHSAIATSEVSLANGTRIGGVRKLFSGNQVGWTWSPSVYTTDMCENPCVVRMYGRWYLFYSGSGWRGPNYATGLARMKSAFPTTVATPIAGDKDPKNVTYIGYGRARYKPVIITPDHRSNPGGFTVYDLWPEHGGFRKRGATWHAFKEAPDKAGYNPDGPRYGSNAMVSLKLSPKDPIAFV